LIRARCRAQVFRKQLKAPRDKVEAVEKQLIDLMHGEAPEGWVIEDVAEIYVANESGVGGRWMPLAEAPTSALKAAAQAK
jgi:hypothetical protein